MLMLGICVISQKSKKFVGTEKFSSQPLTSLPTKLNSICAKKLFICEFFNENGSHRIGEIMCHFKSV